MPSTVIPTGPPTHPALHLRDAKDAHIVLEAVRLNMLPLIRRRLTASERGQLLSGNVFVWEEVENDGGLLRWTDGRRWSQSRMRGDYLFYEEKMETTQEEKDAKAALRVRRTTDPLAPAPPSNRRKDRPNRPNGLTKQTYSALAYLPGSSHPRRWHLVAYFTGDDYKQLPVIENYDYLRNLKVPEGIFVSSKANGVRNDRYSTVDSRECSTQAEFPTQLHLADYSQYPTSNQVPSQLMPSAPPSPATPVSPTHQYPSLQHGQPTAPRRSLTHDTSLPGIAALTTPHAYPDLPSTSHGSYAVRLNYPSSRNYTPLTAEDRRVLNRLRVVL